MGETKETRPNPSSCQWCDATVFHEDDDMLVFDCGTGFMLKHREWDRGQRCMEVEIGGQNAELTALTRKLADAERVVEAAEKERDDWRRRWFVLRGVIAAASAFTTGPKSRAAFAKSLLDRMTALVGDEAAEPSEYDPIDGRPLCPKCKSREGVHGGCDCGFLSHHSSEPATTETKGDG